MTQKDLVFNLLKDAGVPMHYTVIEKKLIDGGLFETDADRPYKNVLGALATLKKEGKVEGGNGDGMYVIKDGGLMKGVNPEESAGSEELEDSLEYCGRNILLYGAPGTGKSYTAKQIVEGDAKNTYEHLNLRNLPKGDFVRVTFHPDTDYASFVGCYKPSMNDK